MDIVINKLVELWLYDIEVFSQAWLYYWVLIPAMFYFVFFLIKWSVLTAPLWIPITIIISVFKSKND